MCFKHIIGEALYVQQYKESWSNTSKIIIQIIYIVTDEI